MDGEVEMKPEREREGSGHIGPRRTLAFVQRDGKLLGASKEK